MSMSIDPESAVVGVLIGIVVGALVTISLIYPRIARAFSKFIACALVGIGTGLLVLGIYFATTSGTLPRENFGPIVFTSIGQTLGWAGGSLAAGITALVLSFVGRNR